MESGSAAIRDSIPGVRSITCIATAGGNHADRQADRLDLSELAGLDWNPRAQAVTSELIGVAMRRTRESGRQCGWSTSPRDTAVTCWRRSQVPEFKPDDVLLTRF
jgi:hypothetical protein